jgi:hypothetical protein
MRVYFVFCGLFIQIEGRKTSLSVCSCSSLSTRFILLSRQPSKANEINEIHWSLHFLLSFLSTAFIGNRKLLFNVPTLIKSLRCGHEGWRGQNEETACALSSPALKFYIGVLQPSLETHTHKVFRLGDQECKSGYQEIRKPSQKGSSLALYHFIY